MSMQYARDIVFLMCKNEGITVAELESGRRTHTLATCRRQIAAKLRLETKLSWREIGTLIGRKSTPRTKEYM